ncbi:MAG: hypothetical protein HWE16_08255 [Gammaproteobacteria bacterium]|nr:hypothetical protein [Gammaproteobacteria bacterium]
MKRINQIGRNYEDCGIACLAMVCDVTYMQAFLAIFRGNTYPPYDTGHKQLINGAHRLNKIACLKKFKAFDDIKKRAIVAINKKENGSWHWIAVDGTCEPVMGIDPKPSKKGKIKRIRGLNAVGMYIEITC